MNIQIVTTLKTRQCLNKSIFIISYWGTRHYFFERGEKRANASLPAFTLSDETDGTRTPDCFWMSRIFFTASELKTKVFEKDEVAKLNASFKCILMFKYTKRNEHNTPLCSSIITYEYPFVKDSNVKFEISK